MAATDFINSKISKKEDFSYTLSYYRFKDKKIVFTNGCFDLLHRGHVEYLLEAASFGDVLILGLNSDSSVKKLKGENRPVQDEESRALILASLHVVDHVILFDEETPIELIKFIMPDVLVKGGDYTTEEIVGSDVVIKNGGAVEVIKFIDGHSTTALVNKIKKDIP